MLSSITPLGERGRNMRWSHTVSWYIFGSLLGGLAIGGLAASIGDAAGLEHVSGSTRLLGAAAFCGAGWLFDAGVLGRPVPSIHRQVNENWLPEYRGWVYGFGFGVQLGFGLATITRTSTIYSALVAAFLSGSLFVGLVIGSLFGAVRAAPIILTRSVNTGQQLARLHQRLQSLDQAARRGAIIGSLLAALSLVGAVIGL